MLEIISANKAVSSIFQLASPIRLLNPLPPTLFQQFSFSFSLFNSEPCFDAAEKGSGSVTRDCWCVRRDL
jgi:hypothetical protein